MEYYRFNINLLTDVDHIDDVMADNLYARCSDGSLGCSNGQIYIDFDRESASLGDAIGSAIKDIEASGYRVGKIEEIEYDIAISR